MTRQLARPCTEAQQGVPEFWNQSSLLAFLHLALQSVQEAIHVQAPAKLFRQHPIQAFALPLYVVKNVLNFPSPCLHPDRSVLNDCFKSLSSPAHAASCRPMAVLAVRLAAAEFDVNVTPDKRRVFMAAEDRLTTLLQRVGASRR